MGLEEAPTEARPLAAVPCICMDGSRAAADRASIPANGSPPFRLLPLPLQINVLIGPPVPGNKAIAAAGTVAVAGSLALSVAVPPKATRGELAAAFCEDAARSLLARAVIIAEALEDAGGRHYFAGGGWREEERGRCSLWTPPLSPLVFQSKQPSPGSR